MLCYNVMWEFYKKWDIMAFCFRKTREMQQKQTLKELPVSERPYEKCEQYGVTCLSDAELLAVIIKCGTKNMTAIDIANQILGYSKETPGLNVLNYLSLQELMSIEGIGKVKSIQLLCVAELTKRMVREKKKEARALLSPNEVADYYMQDLRHLTYEQVILLMVDIKNHIIKDVIISKGTVSLSIADPREIFINAVKYGAVRILLLHNHPSGDPTPSKADISLTMRVKEAGELIGIQLLDHIIIGDNIYISLKEQGIL